MTNLIGQTLNQQYRLDAYLGLTGLAEAYQAYDLRRARPVTIKIIHPDLAQNQTFLRYLDQEAGKLAALAHPNIVRFYEFQQTEDLAFWVTDHAEDAPLSRRLLKADGPLPLAEVNNIFQQTCAALHYAHQQNLAHQAITPAGIRLRPDGGVRVADFGLGRAAALAGAEAGTPAYLSPEQCRGQNVDDRADIYALGIVLYEMVAGRPPFAGEGAPETERSARDKVCWQQIHATPVPPRHFNPNLPPALERVILKALAKAPADRFPDIPAMLAAFDLALGDEVNQAQAAQPYAQPLPAKTPLSASAAAVAARSASAAHPTIPAAPADNKTRPRNHLAKAVVAGGMVIAALLCVILLAGLLLIPNGLIYFDYTKIGRDGGAAQDPDGTTLFFPPGGIGRALWVKLTAIPRSSFLQGEAGDSLRAAAQSIPPYLVMKSPFYQIEHGGGAAQTAVIRVPIPNESEPYSTLDLYTWTGETWQWLSHRKILNQEILEADLDYLPPAVVVMQTHPLQPNLSVDLGPDTVIPDNVKETVVEIHPQGLSLGGEGGIINNLQLPPEARNTYLVVIPTLRNWQDDGAVRSDLVNNLLVDPNARGRHIQAILTLVQQNAYQGIDIDYRGISPDLKQDYTDFLAQLRAALPNDKQLSVRVELPAQVAADTWDAGAYDWPALDRIADVIRMPVPFDPRAYTPGGHVETMLAWAVGQVSRYKLQLLLSTRSTEQAQETTRAINYQQALQPLGVATIVGGANTVAPGQAVEFTLAGPPAFTGLQFDNASGIYWYAYLDDNQVQHTVYLENAASMARKLQLVTQYNLRGVTLQVAPHNDARTWDVLRNFFDLVIPPVEGRQVVVWRVQNEGGGLMAEEMVDLRQPNYKWTAPEAGGTYTISAAIAPGPEIPPTIPRGQVNVLVAP
ncbi:MAG: protein kinase [Anaerolineae bacterium]|nr:protein kinase [Anaerolineae bacterium]